MKEKQFLSVKVWIIAEYGGALCHEKIGGEEVRTFCESGINIVEFPLLSKNEKHFKLAGSVIKKATAFSCGSDF